MNIVLVDDILVFGLSRKLMLSNFIHIKHFFIHWCKQGHLFLEVQVLDIKKFNFST